MEPSFGGGCQRLRILILALSGLLANAAAHGEGSFTILNRGDTPLYVAKAEYVGVFMRYRWDYGGWYKIDPGRRLAIAYSEDANGIDMHLCYAKFDSEGNFGIIQFGAKKKLFDRTVTKSEWELPVRNDSWGFTQLTKDQLFTERKGWAWAKFSHYVQLDDRIYYTLRLSPRLANPVRPLYPKSSKSETDIAKKTESSAAPPPVEEITSSDAVPKQPQASTINGNESSAAFIPAGESTKSRPWHFVVWALIFIAANAMFQFVTREQLPNRWRVFRHTGALHTLELAGGWPGSLFSTALLGRPSVPPRYSNLRLISILGHLLWSIVWLRSAWLLATLVLILLFAWIMAARYFQHSWPNLNNESLPMWMCPKPSSLPSKVPPPLPSEIAVGSDESAPDESKSKCREAGK